MDNFIEQAMRTKAIQDTYELNIPLLHAGMGMCTESAEFLDALKKAIFYKKELDTTNLKEELGDILWYMALAMEELGTNFETEMERVLKKLQIRYPDKFTNDKAENRDLNKEREVLEK